MRLLHILTEGSDPLALLAIACQQPEHEVQVIDLTRDPVAYDVLVESLETCDRVFSW